VRHLPVERFPPLCDYDSAQHLVQLSYKVTLLSVLPVGRQSSLTRRCAFCLQHLDPYSGARRDLGLFWGICRVFRRSFIIQTLLVTADVSPLRVIRLDVHGLITRPHDSQTMSGIATPIGTNRLLKWARTATQPRYQNSSYLFSVI
jgi:hypothetical protein